MVHRHRPIWASLVLSALVAGAGCDSAPPGGLERGGPAPVARASAVATRDPRVTAGRSSDATGPAVLGTTPRWINVAAESGVEFQYYNDEVPQRYFLPEVMGGGVAWLDYDGDGRLDLYLPNGAPLGDSPGPAERPTNRLYRNLGRGRFQPVPQAAGAGDTGYGQGCAVGDFDADGFVDLYVANYGRNVLFHNNGDGTFSEVTGESGVGDDRWSSSCLWLDVDRDGDLDLYVVNYLNVDWSNHRICRHLDQPVYCGPGEYDAVDDAVYLNQGDGTFREATEALGLRADGGKGLAVVALDLDHDLQPEIYVANDMAPNFLFTRSRTRAGVAPPGGNSSEDDPVTPAPYRDVAVPAGCAVSDDGQNEASMGVACADFDNDGYPDIFLTHFFSQKNTLYRNLGGLLFADESRRSRVAATSYQTLGFGTVPLDYDRDGDLDLFVANGHVLGPLHEPCAMRPQLLANDGRGRFHDVSDAAGPYFRQLWLGRGAAGADYDDDGDTDLAVSHIGGPLALLRNETPGAGHFVGFQLTTTERIPPVGGRVVVSRGERVWSRSIAAGGSYLSVGDDRLLFGLGSSDEPVQVEVHWPSGTVQRLADIEVDRYWRVVEGRDVQPP